MIEVLDSLDRPNARKVLIHINNTNPILIDDGPERRALAQHGIEVAHDGMLFEL
jgi:pyrroloquinoline quinone biosynthesis protein B